jgi:hypothetical protein
MNELDEAVRAEALNCRTCCPADSSPRLFATDVDRQRDLLHLGNLLDLINKLDDEEAA